jgi:hypothetical protein
MDDGFHRTPLVHGRLKALQCVFPRAVGAAQYQLSNEVSVVRRNTIGGRARIRSSGSIGKSGMAS